MLLTFCLPGLVQVAAAFALAAPSGGTTATIDDESGGMILSMEGFPAFLIPENEQLDFGVVLNTPFGSPVVGQFILSAGLEDYRAPLSAGPEALTGKPSKSAWLRGNVRGSYDLYTLDHTIEARILPQQEWPRVVYRDIQTGSENRKRELKYGVKDGKPWAWYRKDHHCSGCKRAEHEVEERVLFFKRKVHCDKCRRMGHRDWAEPKTFEIPPRSLDMLSSIYAARTMVREGMDSLEVSVLDRDKRWEMRLSRGDTKVLNTPAGKFDCVAIKLEAKPPEGSEQKEKFKGLFGVRGSLSIWLEQTTGVPVRLEGIIPAGLVSLDVRLELSKFRGTPKEFVSK
ncbi:MAG: hypothetical protein ACI8QZ_001015 [Chlamydiales bacterium]|jgi:hypothetical protein